MNTREAISILIQAGANRLKSNDKVQPEQFYAAMEHFIAIENDRDKLKSLVQYGGNGSIEKGNSETKKEMDLVLTSLAAAEGKSVPFPGWRWSMGTWRKGLPCGGMIEVTHGAWATDSASWYSPFACFFLKDGLRAIPIRGGTVYEVVCMAEEWIINEYPSITGK